MDEGQLALAHAYRFLGRRDHSVAELRGKLVTRGYGAAAIDQAAKLWLLLVFDLGGRGVVTLTPFLDLVLTWNTGISSGLFRQEGPLGQAALRALKDVAAWAPDR